MIQYFYLDDNRAKGRRGETEDFQRGREVSLASDEIFFPVVSPGEKSFVHGWTIYSWLHRFHAAVLGGDTRSLPLSGQGEEGWQ